MYDLAVDGVVSFYQRRPAAKKLVRWEPLVGTVDGSNTVFLLSQPPVLYDSVVLHDASAPTTPLSPTGIDADGGVVHLSPAPVRAVFADYTAVPMYTRQVMDVVFSGFQLMEALWQRGLFLSSDDESYVQGQSGDAHLYVVTKNGNAVSDPVCGDSTFSQSFQQTGLLARCIEVAYLGLMGTETAMQDIAIRERLGGVSVDPTRRPKNIMDARKDAWDELQRALYSAQEQFYGSDAVNAELVDMPSTVDYESIWHWQAGNSGLPFG